MAVDDGNACQQERALECKTQEGNIIHTLINHIKTRKRRCGVEGAIVRPRPCGGDRVWGEHPFLHRPMPAHGAHHHASPERSWIEKITQHTEEVNRCDIQEKSGAAWFILAELLVPRFRPPSVNGPCAIPRFFFFVSLSPSSQARSCRASLLRYVLLVLPQTV